MPRQFRKQKPYIVVFCEGESEQVYTDLKDIASWNKRYKIMKFLRRQRKKPNIRVRLLMTSGCIEYWLMLHYKMTAPLYRRRQKRSR